MLLFIGCFAQGNCLFIRGIHALPAIAVGIAQLLLYIVPLVNEPYNLTFQIGNLWIAGLIHVHDSKLISCPSRIVNAVPTNRGS